VSLDELDKKIIARIQGDIPLEPRPFRQMAQELGIDEQEVVRRIRSLAERGIMRRFGATLRHQRSGFTANVMVAWQVEEPRVEEVGRRLASFRHVSHCYQRERCGDFPYNLYSMVHGRDEQQCRDLVEEMARAVGIEDYALLFSRRELKKTSMRYFEP